MLPRPWLLCVLSLGVVLCASDATENWPQFRGVDGAGVAAPEARPPLKIGPAENVLWRVDVPWSPSSPCVWGDRIFLTTFAEPNLEVRAYDRATGKLLWTRALKPEGIEEFHRVDGSPAASTPATDGKHVVSYFGSWGLVCHDFAGKELWRRPMPVAESGGRFGTGTSPIIVGGRVLLNRDQYRYSTLLAVAVATGATVWETPRPESSGSFGTPAIWQQGGAEEVVLAGSAQLKGYDLASGAERWTITNVTGTVCTTPVVGEGLLFFAAWSPGQADSPRQTWEAFLKAHDKNGDGIVALEEIDVARRDYLRAFDRNRDGKITTEDWDRIKAGDARAENVLIAVKPGGRGDISESHVTWKYRRALPYVPSPLFYGGRLYFVRDQGLMSSLDPKTGEPFYAQERLGPPGNYYASPVAADGRIYVASLPGKVSVVQAGGAKPEVLHTADFGERILATPALVGKNLYLRTQTKLYAFGE
ncbi:MAG: PQQ-binding-like beta-propeller repeat protein [Opitutaceae bacterium]|nr:PQQ-binding-like beta-propeller repeat protein [Opitutaceae bacterium]